MKRAEREKREASEFFGALNKYSRVDHCVLCDRKMTSPCNSHVVPQFILKNISEDGKVSYGHALFKKKVLGLDKPTGINNAYTFRIICRECDRSRFINYENPYNLKEFDSLDLNLKKQILCEMAIKAHLSHINMKYRKIVMMDMVNQGRLGELEKRGEFVFAERFDIEEHTTYINYLSKKHGSNNNPFEVLYNRVLDYKTKFATQTVINFNFDLNGEQIFDPFCFENNECRYFYLMILPLEDCTRVMFYIEKKSVKNVSRLIEQFDALTEEEKLHFLFIALIIHDQQFYISPSLASSIHKNDKKLIKLYTKTNEINLKNEKELCNFRKYKNYLLKEI